MHGESIDDKAAAEGATAAGWRHAVVPRKRQGCQMEERVGVQTTGEKESIKRYKQRGGARRTSGCSVALHRTGGGSHAPIAEAALLTNIRRLVSSPGRRAACRRRTASGRSAKATTEATELSKPPQSRLQACAAACPPATEPASPRAPARPSSRACQAPTPARSRGALAAGEWGRSGRPGAAPA